MEIGCNWCSGESLYGILWKTGSLALEIMQALPLFFFFFFFFFFVGSTSKRHEGTRTGIPLESVGCRLSVCRLSKDQGDATTLWFWQLAPLSSSRCFRRA